MSAQSELPEKVIVMEGYSLVSQELYDAYGPEFLSELNGGGTVEVVSKESDYYVTVKVPEGYEELVQSSIKNFSIVDEDFLPPELRT